MEADIQYEMKQLVRICICTHHSLMKRYGGFQDRIVNFARNLSNEGGTVYLVDRSMNKSMSSLVIDDDKYYFFKNGELKVKSYPLFVLLFFPGLIKHVQMFLLFFLKSASRFSEGWGLISDAFDLQLFLKLFFVSKKEKIDIIQSEFPTTIIPSFLVKKLLKIPIVYDAHNIEQNKIERMRGNRLVITCLQILENFCCHVSDAIFAVSKLDKEVFMSWGVPSEKILVVPNSVDVNIFNPKVDGEKIRRKYRLQNFTLMFHGALDYLPNKEAVNILVYNILPSILERCPKTHLLIVGKNPPHISHPNVVITGFIEDLPQYIAAADVGVVPLLNGGGTRIKVLEYMACGKPVVSTKVGVEGIQLNQGKDILISKSIPSDFVSLVCGLYEDKELREKLGNNARKKVEALYSWKRSARKAMNVHQFVANSSRASVKSFENSKKLD